MAQRFEDKDFVLKVRTGEDADMSAYLAEAYQGELLFTTDEKQLWIVNEDADSADATATLIFPQPYGNMYMYQGSETGSVASDNTWYELTSGLSGGEEFQCTFQNSHEMVVSRAGHYKVTWSSACSTATANDQIMVAVAVNGTAVEASANHTTVSTANDKVSLSGCTILDLSAGDAVSMAYMNETAARDITFEHITCCLKRIGD